jgi:hypothetical protein
MSANISISTAKCGECRFAIDFAYDNVRRMAHPSSQSEKLKKAARQVEADEDEKRWEERLKRVARVKTLPDPPPHDPVVRKDGKSG